MNYYLKIILIFLIFSSLKSPLYAQEDSIDTFVKLQMQKRKVPGLQLAIIRNGVLIKSGNYGWANLQDSIPVSNKTVFSINSITKAFTGVAIMQLVEAGKLDLSAPVATYLTDLPDSWKTVTIQQLLSHTSGIPDIVDEEESVLISPSGEAAAWKQVKSLPMDFLPGEQFKYNQTNYLLLGRIIDTLSGMPFTEFIQKEQLEKAEMPRTIRSGFGANKELVFNAAAGYRYLDNKLINLFFSFPPSLQTAAGMSSTASEMAKWILALQNMKLLKQEKSILSLFKPAKLNNGKTEGFNSLLNGYAAGWPVIIRNEHPAYAAVGGGRSAVFVYPDDSLTIIVLTNLAGGSPDVFIDELAGIFIPDMKESNGFGLSSAIKQLKTKLDNSGYTNAIDVVSEIKKQDGNVEFTERELNAWGYRLIKQNKLKDALEIFKLNVFLYPRSANAYDSLAEIYESLGEKKLAILNYQQSLKLDPENNNASERIKNLSTNE